MDPGTSEREDPGMGSNSMNGTCGIDIPRPFRAGLSLWGASDPGRCPGLDYFAPSGRGTGLASRAQENTE